MRNKKLSLFKIASVVAFFAFVGFSSVKVSQNNVTPLKADKSFNQSLQDFPNVSYKSYDAGYYDITNCKTDTGQNFPTLSTFSSEYKVFYIGGETEISSLISYKVADRSTIKITCPFILPFAMDYSQESPRANGNLYRYIWYDDLEWEMCSEEDAWKSVNKIASDKKGQPNFSYSGMTITGKKLGSSSEESIKNSCTITPVTSVGNRYAIQNLTIKMPNGEEVYDYDTITITLPDIYFTSVATNSRSSGNRVYIEYLNDDAESKSFTLNPSSQLKVSGGSKVARVSKNAVWYEAPRPANKGGGAGSFLTKAGANDTIFSELKKDASAHKFSGITRIEGKFDLVGTYNDFSGVTKNYNKDIEAHSTSQFIGSGPFDIIVVPEYETYESSDRKHEIKKLWAFNQAESDGILNAFLNSQKEILVYEATAYKEKFPAQQYDTALTDQNAIFDDYDFYDTNSSPLSFTNRENFGYQYLTPGQTTMQTGTDTQSLSIDKVNSFYSIVNKQENSVPASYTNIFNVHDYSNEQWKQNVVASGSTEFTNHFNALFTRDATQYLGDPNETNNKVVFKSADAMFIRITKNGMPQDLKAETKYTFDSLGKATAVPPTGETSYTFDCPGSYEISIVNRGSSKVLNKQLIIYNINDLNVSTTKDATNEELSFKVNRPAGTNFTSLKVYQSTKVVGAEGEHFGKEEITPLTSQQLDDGEFTLLTDSTSKDTFTYNETPSLTNKYRYTFYVVTEVVDITKAYYLYWNFVPVQPDAIAVDVNPTGWQENVGYFTTFNVSMTSSTGWSVDPAATYDVSIAGDAIEIDGNSLKAVKEGKASATFTIHGTKISTTKEFNITDTEELRKEIRCSEKEVNLFTGRTKAITAYANPTSYFLDQDLTYTIANEEVATISDGIITAVAPGETTLTISHSSTELKDLVIPIKVEDLVIYNLTVNEPSHGSISVEGSKIQYEKGETAKITIKAETGYYIQTVDFSGETTSYDESQLELTLDKVMDKDYVLTVTFTEIPIQPEPTPGGGGSSTGIIIGVCCGVGAVAIGVGTFLIIRAKKVGSMKK